MSLLLLSLALAAGSPLPVCAQQSTAKKPPKKSVSPTKATGTPVPAPTPAAPKPEKIVGFPQDAGPHDTTASMEWWYFNSFLKTETGRNLAVVGSFFRTGLSADRKGHYLIYSLIDLDAKEDRSYSVLDKTEIALLTSITSLRATTHPDDPRPLQLLRVLQRGELPPPHQNLNGDAMVTKNGLFSIALDNNSLAQMSEDGRTWHVQLNGDNWSMELTLTQPERPAMLPGGRGYTGIKRPEDFYYLSLTRMQASGTMTADDGVVEKLSGDGWLDRQWGAPDFVASYGWDWLGLQLDNGDDLILDRIREVGTGKIVRYRATILTKDGRQIVEPAMEMKPLGQFWRDKVSRITFPARFEITLPSVGYKFTVTPAFPEQTIPVIGVGDAIWEGVVKVEGTDKDGGLITGRGFLELVGYRK